MVIKLLTGFLVEANKAGYAVGDEKKWTKEKDGSTSINFSSGDWQMHDNFFGGEPYGGRIVVSYRGKPYWMMVYYGYVSLSVKDPNQIYVTLRKALAEMPTSAPYRGPKELKAGEFVYQNFWRGKMDQYRGEEKISHANKVVYRAWYMGGLVDQRQAV